MKHAGAHARDPLSDDRRLVFPDAGIGWYQANQAASFVGHLNRANTIELLGQLAKLGPRGFEIVFERPDFNAAAGDTHGTCQIDVSIVQNAAHVAEQQSKNLLAYGVAIDLEQHGRAALQLGCERNASLRPSRPATDGLVRNEIGTANPQI